MNNLRQTILIALFIIGCDSFFDQGITYCILKSDYRLNVNFVANEASDHTNGVCANELSEEDCHNVSLSANYYENDDKYCADRGYTEKWKEADCNAFFAGEPIIIKYCEETEWFYNPDSLITGY